MESFLMPTNMKDSLMFDIDDSNSEESSKFKELDRLVFEVFNRLRKMAIVVNGSVIKSIGIKIEKKSEIERV